LAQKFAQPPSAYAYTLCGSMAPGASLGVVQIPLSNTCHLSPSLGRCDEHPPDLDIDGGLGSAFSRFGSLAIYDPRNDIFVFGVHIQSLPNVGEDMDCRETRCVAHHEKCIRF
jgi:hypothetical protein